MSLVLAATAAALYSCGTYLLLQRRLTRIILGLVMLGHGSVLLLLVSGGRAGQVPITDGSQGGTFSDPFVQALGLTAIVITFAVTAFLLALAYRSWELTDDDETQDDLEDERLAATEGDEDLEEEFEHEDDQGAVT
jgi:multicomponent Na+:H+ antiporter subunit C